MMPVAAVILFVCLNMATAAALARPFEATVGNLRIQMLSPTMIRVEDQGPHGFEDRATFTVVGRHLFNGTYLIETIVC